MSDVSQGPGWWLASDGKWYSPEQHSSAAIPTETQSSVSTAPSNLVQPQSAPSVSPPTTAAPPVPKALGNTSGTAIAAMWISFASFACFPFGIVSIYLAMKARKDISESGGLLGGDGLAKAAIGVSIAGLALNVLFGLIFFISLLSVGSSLP